MYNPGCEQGNQRTDSRWHLDPEAGRRVTGRKEGDRQEGTTERDSVKWVNWFLHEDSKEATGLPVRVIREGLEGSDVLGHFSV